MKSFILAILLIITSILSAQSTHLENYQNKLNSFKVNDKISYANINEDAKKELLQLYNNLSEEEQQQLEIGIHTLEIGKLPYVQPTEKQMTDWLNSKQFGVWIDGKRISNADLKKFKNTDFSQTHVSKLSKNTVNYGKHYYQVDLMTNAYYENYTKEKSTQVIGFHTVKK